MVVQSSSLDQGLNPVNCSKIGKMLYKNSFINRNHEKKIDKIEETYAKRSRILDNRKIQFDFYTKSKIMDRFKYQENERNVNDTCTIPTNYMVKKEDIISSRAVNNSSLLNKHRLESNLINIKKNLIIRTETKVKNESSQSLEKRNYNQLCSLSSVSMIDLTSNKNKSSPYNHRKLILSDRRYVNLVSNLQNTRR